MQFNIDSGLRNSDLMITEINYSNVNVFYRLYVRLALLMGISWILGIVAGYVDAPELWIIFIIVNTLQGFFIFAAFTCSSKTRKVLRTKLWCKSNLPTASWTWSGGGNQMIRTTSSSSGNTKRSDLEGRESYDSSQLSNPHHMQNRSHSPHQTHQVHHQLHKNMNAHSHAPHHPHHNPQPQQPNGNGKMYRSPSTELYRSLHQNWDSDKQTCKMKSIKGFHFMWNGLILQRKPFIQLFRFSYFKNFLFYSV